MQVRLKLRKLICEPPKSTIQTFTRAKLTQTISKKWVKLSPHSRTQLNAVNTIKSSGLGLNAVLINLVVKKIKSSRQKKQKFGKRLTQSLRQLSERWTLKDYLMSSWPDQCAQDPKSFPKMWCSLFKDRRCLKGTLQGSSSFNSLGANSGSKTAFS